MRSSSDDRARDRRPSADADPQSRAVVVGGRRDGGRAAEVITHVDGEAVDAEPGGMRGQAGRAVGVGDVLEDADRRREHPRRRSAVPVRGRVGVAAQQAVPVAGRAQPGRVRGEFGQCGAGPDGQQEPRPPVRRDAGVVGDRVRRQSEAARHGPQFGSGRAPQADRAGVEPRRQTVTAPARPTGEGAVGRTQDGAVVVVGAGPFGEHGEGGDGAVAAGGQFGLGGEEPQGAGGTTAFGPGRAEEDGVGRPPLRRDAASLLVGERRIVQDDGRAAARAAPLTRAHENRLGHGAGLLRFDYRSDRRC